MQTVLLLLFSVWIICPQVVGQENTQFHYLQTQMFLSNSQPEQAFTHIQIAIELDPNRPEFFVLRALCYRQLDRSDLFLKDYRHALSMNPHIIKDSFLVKNNLPRIMYRHPVDTNPYMHGPDEFQRKLPQTFGPILVAEME